MTRIEIGVNEKRDIKQVVMNEDIIAADWTVSPDGPILNNQQGTGDYNIIRFQSTEAGHFVLQCAVQTTSGQVLISKAQIVVT